MIDLSKLLDDSNISKSDLAVRLFPNNKFPDASLARVLNGLSFLDSNQILILSEILDTPVENLFNASWKGKAKKNELVLTNGEYKAILNIEDKHTRLFHNDTEFFDTVFHSSEIALSEYIKMLNRVIENHIINQ